MCACVCLLTKGRKLSNQYCSIVHELRTKERTRERELCHVCREDKKEEEVEALTAFEVCSVATTGTDHQDRHQLNVPIYRQGLVRERRRNSLSFFFSFSKKSFLSEKTTRRGQKKVRPNSMVSREGRAAAEQQAGGEEGTCTK